MKKILLLTGSPRRNGNSDLLADSFSEGAIAQGHQVIRIRATDLRIYGCNACNQCFSNGDACIFPDDFNEFARQVEESDMLVFSTPLYWFTFPAKVKAAIDKLHSFTTVKRPMNIKECALMVCGTAKDEKIYDGIVRCYEEIANYNGWIDRGKLLTVGIREKGAILNTHWLEMAQTLGASI